MTFEGFLKSLNLESRSDHYKKDKYNKQVEIPTEPEGEERTRKIKFGGFALCC